MMVIKPEGTLKVLEEAFRGLETRMCGICSRGSYHYLENNGLGMPYLSWCWNVMHGDWEDELKVHRNTRQKFMASFGREPFIFQDDNASCIVEEWKRRNELSQLPSSAQSPDLSPIENIWLIMKNKII
jgi:hypothetical protein